MKVVVPYTVRHSLVENALPDATWVDVSSDPEAYYRLLRELWAAQETTVIVEHDNIPPPGLVEEMYVCPYAWCVAPYMVMGEMQVALGCAKFHGVLMRDTQPFDPDDRFWAHQDVCISMGLQAAGVVPHVHPTLVAHLNPRASKKRGEA